MMEFLCLVLDYLTLVSAVLLAYLPMTPYLKKSLRHTAVQAGTLTVLLVFAGAFICIVFHARLRLLMIPLASAACIFYMHTLNVSPWKSASVFLAVYAVFSSLVTVIVAFYCVLAPSHIVFPGSLSISLVCNLACLGFVLAVWYPATHAVREFLEEKFLARTWYVFWILPVLFIILNLSMQPLQPEILKQGRLKQMYPIICLFLLLLLLLFYAMFYFVAFGLNRNHRLSQENQLLSMQQARYSNLKHAIEETRQARHDLRHHFAVLRELAGREEWNTLTAYLNDAYAKIPGTELHLCDNPAADSVAGHYALLCRRSGIPCSFSLDLPARLPVAEIDLCMVLSNLLENAMEASLKISPDRQKIYVQAHLHSEHMVLLSVENTFEGEICEKDGVLQSTKRKGAGVGTQSVRHIAEKGGGYCRFYSENGVFHANVMLRGGKSSS